MVDASTQVQQVSEDKICNTECQCQANSSTQMQPHIEDKEGNTDAIVQHQIAFDKCEAKLLRLTVGVKRLEVTLRKLRGYEAKGAVSDKEPAENLSIKNEHYTNVSDMSNNTTIASSSAETLSDGEAIDCLPASQTGNQTEVIFDTFQTKLD
ncbi:hypothetical protein CBL_05101 [Carabus blaptoides fortunei]